jgi:hypothetical protein
MRRSLKWVLLIIVVLAVVSLAIFIWAGKNRSMQITDFDSCAKKYPVMLTYPEQCSIPNGPTFTKY